MALCLKSIPLCKIGFIYQFYGCGVSGVYKEGRGHRLPPPPTTTTFKNIAYCMYNFWEGVRKVDFIGDMSLLKGRDRLYLPSVDFFQTPSFCKFIPSLLSPMRPRLRGVRDQGGHVPYKVRQIFMYTFKSDDKD